MTYDKSVGEALSRLRGPDFLCIGQPKAGTGWFYDMLRLDPNFWMPPIKELNYFNKRFPIERAKKLSDKMAGDLAKTNTRRQKVNRNPLDERDAQFLKHAVTYGDSERSIDWYRELFTPKAHLLSGDMTPANARLAEADIAALARALPSLRLLLLVRDPVARFWSQFNMKQRRMVTGKSAGVAQPDGDLQAAFDRATSIEQIGSYLRDDRAREVFFPTSIYAKWNRHFEAAQISIAFFDDICASPDSVLERFREDLGLPASQGKEREGPLDYNRKSNHMKREMSGDSRAVLVDAFREELIRCAEQFGGPAESWPRLYGLV